MEPYSVMAGWREKQHKVSATQFFYCKLLLSTPGDCGSL